MEDQRNEKRRDDRSFVEGVKDFRGMEERREEYLSEEEETLYLDRNIADNKWLNSCAIGVLKVFSNVSKVKRRLIERGFRFKIKYLGGKSVLWDFESICETEGFIKSRLFWEDTFCSMEKGSELTEYRSMSKGVNISGFPLSYWNQSFFRKIGNYMGEFLCADNDSILKNRLDRSRILISPKGQQQCSREMKVVDGGSFFSVQVEMDSKTVDLEWVNGVLGLDNPNIPESMESSEQGERNSIDSRVESW